MAARAVLFAEPRSRASVALVSAALRVARARSDVEIIAVCDAGRRPALAGVAPGRVVAAAFAKRLFDQSRPIVLHRPALQSLAGAARKAGVPLVVPPERNVNHPEFIGALAHQLRADFALSLICSQIFGRELLAAFRAAVNYHNGLLPEYRGLRATAWSVYRDEARTGFTFHHMNEKIDQGAILHQGDLPIVSAKSVAQLECEKTILGAKALHRAFDSLVRGEPGRPQAGPGSYFGRRDCERVQKVGDPSAVSWEDLARRIRAFDFVEIVLAGSCYEITKVRRLGLGEHGGRLEFRTLDDVRAEPVLFMHLPLPLYRLYRLAGGGR